MLMPINIKV